MAVAFISPKPCSALMLPPLAATHSYTCGSMCESNWMGGEEGGRASRQAEAIARTHSSEKRTLPEA